MKALNEIEDDNKTLTLDDTQNHQEENTFKIIKRIQNLLKKESALKQLCKKIIII